MINDNIKLKKLTIYNYNIRLKEKCNSCFIKDFILINLQKNNLHFLDIQ